MNFSFYIGYFAGTLHLRLKPQASGLSLLKQAESHANTLERVAHIRPRIHSRLLRGIPDWVKIPVLFLKVHKPRLRMRRPPARPDVARVGRLGLCSRAFRRQAPIPNSEQLRGEQPSGKLDLALCKPPASFPEGLAKPLGATT